MKKPTCLASVSAIGFFFVCALVPAYAQHAGGGGFHGGGGGGFHGGGGGGFHGGGFAGGGGFHPGGGAGFHSAPAFHGGGFRSGTFSPPPAGVGGPHFAPSSPMRPGGGSTMRPGNFSRPGRNFAGGNQRAGNSFSAPPPVSDGRWHSFAPATGNRGVVSAPSQTGPSPSAGGLHVLNNHEPASSGSVRSFSGQGHEIWENSAIARNVIPRSQSLTSLKSTLREPPSSSSGLRSNPSLFGTSRVARGSTLAGNRVFSSSLKTGTATQQLRSSRLPYGTARPCWNCGSEGWRTWAWNRGWGWHGGWGWGWGFGWGGWGWGGWPWLGYWGWSPFWYNSWWGWPSYGYGYYGYPSVYIYNSSGYSDQNDNSAPPPQQYDQDNQGGQDNEGGSNGNWIMPNEPNPSSLPNSPGINVPVLIYMKNGAVYSVRDYWMTGDVFYYVLMDGNQNSVSLEQVDLPRTNEENAKSGVKFIIKSEPSITVPPAGGTSAPPAAPAPDQPTTAPTQQLDAVPQPEART